jgi:hypothetical protein
MRKIIFSQKTYEQTWAGFDKANEQIRSHFEKLSRAEKFFGIANKKHCIGFSQEKIWNLPTQSN